MNEFGKDFEQGFVLTPQINFARERLDMRVISTQYRKLMFDFQTLDAIQLVAKDLGSGITGFSNADDRLQHLNVIVSGLRHPLL